MAVNLIGRKKVYKNDRLLCLPAGNCFLCDAQLAQHDCLLCQACVLDLPFIHIACPSCSVPRLTPDICVNCLSRRRPYINRTIAVFRYEYPVNKMVGAFKFNNRLPLAAFFARLLLARVKIAGAIMPECLLPVPLHPGRLSQRGYNQAMVLARELQKLCGIPVEHKLCQRRLETREQSLLAGKARHQNVKDAFVVSTAGVEFKHIALVDDVVTTGATVYELARVLARAGVETIDVWSCCRAG